MNQVHISKKIEDEAKLVASQMIIDNESIKIIPNTPFGDKLSVSLDSTLIKTFGNFEHEGNEFFIGLRAIKT